MQIKRKINNAKAFATTILAMLIAVSTYAKEPECAYPPTKTCRFAEHDGKKMFIDFYKPADKSKQTLDGKQKPAVIFIFGGGFINGNRAGTNYTPWFKMLNDNGYPVFSIDYRLGMKDVKAKRLKFINAMEKAIMMGVEDLYLATNYIMDHCNEFGVKPNNLVISGSSAGAIIAQQAEYEICRQSEIAKMLPEGFNYAGVMAFSGAIFSKHGKLKYKKEPCPILMLHGTADKVVTYTQIKFLWLGFFGADKIAERFKTYGYNYNIIRFKNNKHEIAECMDKTADLQLKFLECNVIRKQRRIVDALIEEPAIPKNCNIESPGDLYN